MLLEAEMTEVTSPKTCFYNEPILKGTSTDTTLLTKRYSQPLSCRGKWVGWTGAEEVAPSTSTEYRGGKGG